MKGSTPQFRMADRLTDGRLCEILLQHEADGHSLDRIARELYANHRIEITRQTVGNWLALAHAAAGEAPSEAAS